MAIGSNLIFYNELSSTNEKASELLRTGEQPEGTIVYTSYQSAGKGQGLNKWESERGKNLLFSIILYPDSVTPGDQFHISMTISLGICDFLDKHCTGARIKWPNDIYLGDQKIAGILIENSILGNIIESCVVGIGLNINQENFPGIVPPPVSLKMATGKEYILINCMRDLFLDLENRYRFLLYDDRNRIRHDYLARLYRFMEWTSFKTSETIFIGRITDVLVSGLIRVEEKNGRVREFSAKDFSFLS